MTQFSSTLSVKRTASLAMLCLMTLPLSACSGISVSDWWREFKGERKPQIVDGARRQPVFNPKKNAKSPRAPSDSFKHNTAPAAPHSSYTPQPVPMQDAPPFAGHQPKTAESSWWDETTGEVGSWFEDDAAKPQKTQKTRARVDARPPAHSQATRKPLSNNATSVHTSDYPPIANVPPAPPSFADVRASRGADEQRLLQQHQGSLDQQQQLTRQIEADQPYSLLTPSFTVGEPVASQPAPTTTLSRPAKPALPRAVSNPNLRQAIILDVPAEPTAVISAPVPSAPVRVAPQPAPIDVPEMPVANSYPVQSSPTSASAAVSVRRVQPAQRRYISDSYYKSRRDAMRR